MSKVDLRGSFDK